MTRQSPKNSREVRRWSKAIRRALPAWKLQDAKAHFSQVVREAIEHGPQRVTLHGKDAVVILSAADYARLAPAAAQPSLHALLSKSPLRDLDFEHGSVRSPVRDVEL
jgi:prevent-host-death family protein